MCLAIFVMALTRYRGRPSEHSDTNNPDDKFDSRRNKSVFHHKLCQLIKGSTEVKNITKCKHCFKKHKTA